MKLCDRCKVGAGCCLDYLGETCFKARARECPDIQPTNAEAMAGMNAKSLAWYLAGMCEEVPDFTMDSILTWLNTEV